jgi:hypothetical protein
MDYTGRFADLSSDHQRTPSTSYPKRRPGCETGGVSVRAVD